MSVHVSSWVWKHAEAKGNALLVLLALADMANDDGVCWPSKQHLADRTRLSLSTVKRVIGQLREGRQVVADVSMGRSNVYRILMEKQGQSEPLEGQSDPGGQFEPSTKLTQGVGHSYDPGGGSTVTPYTSVKHQETSRDTFDVDEDVPKGSRTAVAIPKPFVVTAEMRAWAASKAPSVAVDAVTSDFVAYWREGNGKGRRMKNWTLTWRNWLKRDHARNVERGWKPTNDDDRKVIRGGRVVA